MRTLIDRYKQDEAHALRFMVLFGYAAGLFLLVGLGFSISGKSQAPIVPVAWMMTFVFLGLAALALVAHIIAGVRRLRLEGDEESAERLKRPWRA